MAQQGSLERDRLVYTPGDGYVYRWDGGPWITVHKIMYNAGGTRVEIPQAEVIAAPSTRTGTQLVATVDAWRLVR